MNKKAKIILKVFLAIISIIILIYVGVSIYLSVISYNLVEASQENKGVLPDKYKEIISEENFERLYWLNGDPRDFSNCDIVYSHTLSFTYFTGFTNATATYKYQGTVTDKLGELQCGGATSCKIHWTFSNGHWIVSEYWEDV